MKWEAYQHDSVEAFDKNQLRFTSPRENGLVDALAVNPPAPHPPPPPDLVMEASFHCTNTVLRQKGCTPSSCIALLYK